MELKAGLRMEADLPIPRPLPSQVLVPQHKLTQQLRGGGGVQQGHVLGSPHTDPRAPHLTPTWAIQEAWCWTVFPEPERGHVARPPGGPAGWLEPQGRPWTVRLLCRALSCSTSIQQGRPSPSRTEVQGRRRLTEEVAPRPRTLWVVRNTREGHRLQEPQEESCAAR